MYTVYGDMLSGNCYKIKLAMNMLGIDHRWQHVDVLRGETRTPAFLQLNPNAKIPLLQFSNGETLAESNAILFFLAEETPLFPKTALARARVMQWLFFEQYSHEPYIATSRFIVKYLGKSQERVADLAAKRAGGEKALDVMEQVLSKQAFIAGEAFSIADIALYAYTHVAHEGEFSLEGYPAIQRWLDAVASLPGYISMSEAIAQTSSAQA